jgi:transcriptional regulator with XRE-family HTH domain
LWGVYGAFLRQIRESRDMSQADLAEVVGISQPNLSAYERDRRTPGLDVFNRILVACGYQVAADGGGTVLHMPLPRGAGWSVPDDLPPRNPDDPPDEPPALEPDVPLEARALAVVEAVELAEAIMEWSGR